MRLLEKLDERQVRLGYVNCVVLMAGRHLNTRQALRRRFDSFVFRPIEEDTDEGRAFLSFISEAGKATLAEQDRQRKRERGGQKSVYATASLMLRPRGGDKPRRHSSHLWLAQECMPSHLGPLAPERSEVFLEHTKHLGLLSETYALAEPGHILKELLLSHDPAMQEGRATPNPMFVGCRRGVQALYLWCLLEHDAVTPFLLQALLERGQNDPELLPRAVDALIAAFQRGAKIDAALELKHLRDYRARLGSGPKIHRHHIRPRLEHYVDLGLLARAGDHTRTADTVYEATPATRRSVDVLKPVLEDPRGAQRVLDKSFFSAAATIYSVPNASRCSPVELLRYFAAGFELVGREIGFTPGRTVALAGCLLALEQSRVVEVEDMFDVVYSAARSPFADDLIFSGGSRFDREFLIRVKPELRSRLDRALAAGQSDLGTVRGGSEQ
jgi:hypothetical protein